MRNRERAGREGEPDGRADGQPERQDNRQRRRGGYDADKKIKGRKRHALELIPLLSPTN